MKRYFPKLGSTERAEIARRYQLGEGTTDLADDFGVTRQAVGDVLYAAGITIERRREHPEWKREKVLTAYQGGMSARDAGALAGVPYSTAREMVARAGLTRSPSEARQLYCDRVRDALKERVQVVQACVEGSVR